MVVSLVVHGAGVDVLRVEGAVHALHALEEFIEGDRILARAEGAEDRLDLYSIWQRSDQ